MSENFTVGLLVGGAIAAFVLLKITDVGLLQQIPANTPTLTPKPHREVKMQEARRGIDESARRFHIGGAEHPEQKDNNSPNPAFPTQEGTMARQGAGLPSELTLYQKKPATNPRMDLSRFASKMGR